MFLECCPVLKEVIGRPMERHVTQGTEVDA